ncbi:MAG: TerC family protein [Chloroflexi bacterium]|nr:MAG: TerC family protein [Chloroflexota bacterium]
MHVTIWGWISFHLFIFFLLALDLGVFNRKSHVISTKEAAVWSAIWIGISLLFNAGVYYFAGHEAGLQFLTGYLLEKSLSVDNIFVFVLLFNLFAVPPIYQHRLLFWGVLGALIMRGALIGVGAYLISQFHWILYLFGLFLVFTGIKLLFQKDDEVIDPDKNPLVRALRRILPVTSGYRGQKFFIREAGQLAATPLFFVLLVVETTDLLFALDSIPAIFAVTQDPFIVYTSNVFAILGLRALYFLLASMMGKFRFLKMGLSGILVFIGVKMLVMDIYHIPITLSLGVIASVLTLSVLASLFIPERKSEAAHPIVQNDTPA